MSDLTKVGDLIREVPDGETRVFTRTFDPVGTEPPFYRVTTAGEYPESPRWDNAIPLNDRPRPAINEWPYVRLGTAGEFQLSINASGSEIADIYKVATGLYLVSGKLLSLLDRVDPSAFERASARMHLSTGEIVHDYSVVMPSRVVDAVDTSKTDVTITRTESPEGSRRYVTHVRYALGAVMRPEMSDAPTFLRRYGAKWYWREDVVLAAVETGARGLRAVFCSDLARRPEIRS